MRQLFVLAISAIFLIGCTSVVNTFTKEPFEPDPTKIGIISALNDKKMTDQVLTFMEKYNKEALPLAQKFIDNAFKAN